MFPDCRAEAHAVLVFDSINKSIHGSHQVLESPDMVQCSTSPTEIVMDELPRNWTDPAPLAANLMLSKRKVVTVAPLEDGVAKEHLCRIGCGLVMCTTVKYIKPSTRSNQDPITLHGRQVIHERLHTRGSLS